ncbi:MAG: DNA adenine methylase [Iphinoe sp. HA4291-MV1]|jgi:DNA adenine methylase|nr:DNA adenine methylase [Iphinoe sp. HA4291-MV1]
MKRQIVKLSIEGKSVRNIAAKLSLSPTTVQTKRAVLPNTLRKPDKQRSTLLNPKSPLRFPGGKSKVLDCLLPLIPTNIEEFREPMVGGGSMFLAVKTLLEASTKFWINDLNPNVAAFWQSLQASPDDLLQSIQTLRQQYPDGKKLYQCLVWNYPVVDALSRATRCFILNRITFSGAADAGGYSAQAFTNRFTDASLEKLRTCAPHLTNVRVTNESYEQSLQAPGNKVFIFLDPPYYTASSLYGERGEIHDSFDHVKFAHHAQQSPHQWLITYDDTPEIRQLFHFAHIQEYSVQYGMNNYKQSHAAKGKELLIRNFSP